MTEDKQKLSHDMCHLTQTASMDFTCSVLPLSLNDSDCEAIAQASHGDTSERVSTLLSSFSVIRKKLKVLGYNNDAQDLKCCDIFLIDSSTNVD